MHNHQCLWNIFRKSRPIDLFQYGSMLPYRKIIVWCTMWLCTSHAVYILYNVIVYIYVVYKLVVYTCRSHVFYVVYNVFLETNLHILMLWGHNKNNQKPADYFWKIVVFYTMWFCTSHVVYSCTSHVMYNVILGTNLHILIFWGHNKNN